MFDQIVWHALVNTILAATIAWFFHTGVEPDASKVMMWALSTALFAGAAILLHFQP